MKNQASNYDEKLKFIYAPNVHLFAYSLHKDTKQDNLLWQESNLLLSKLTQKQLPLSDFNFSSTHRRRLLLPKNFLTNKLPLKSKVEWENSQLKITGFASPLQLEDSYCLSLNLRRPETENGQKTSLVNVNFYSKFNPGNCLIFKDDKQLFLGETLLITGWLTPEQKQYSRQNNNFFKDLATDCVKALIPERKKRPSFYRQGELFGSPIFAYGLPSQEANTPQILVWFFLQPETNQKFVTCSEQLFDLFFFQHKAIKAFQNSRVIYNVLAEKLTEIEEDANQFQGINTRNKYLSNRELKILQDKLQKLPKDALGFAENLRLLSAYENTISLNQHNYREKLAQISENVGEKDLSFLADFEQKSCIIFRDQIQGDLNYFVPGVGLVDRAIASIRGLVEIDQAESDRQLNLTVAMLGVGIAAGGIFATSYALSVNEAIQLPNLSLPLKPLHPVTKSFLWSMAIGIFAAILTGIIMGCWEKWRKRR
ncbi:MAG: hypothetical protein SAJ37_05210 [Oscillatoria sp. PMC 1068.18]|nr:hypothetical protein [Oscillatoria sp. PMC 1076.18]MEC4988129.1 hypothetical protein [Oscillatoria sp. PMC 1068.18]